MISEDIKFCDYEIERRKLFEPLRFFRPNISQRNFINAVADENSKTILFPAGNWSGKTAASIAILGILIWPDEGEDEIFQVPFFKKWESFGFQKQARIISTPKELENIGSIQKEILRWWPRGKYTSEKKGKQFPCEFKSDTGWIIDLMSYEQQESEFEGATISFFIFNEPPPENIFEACLRRKKYGGKILMPMTPLNNSAWIYDRLVSHDWENGIRVIYGDTEDNCKEHSPNGVLPHQAIVDLGNSLDDDDREACLHGKFSHLAGQIYKSFSRAVHIFKPESDLKNFLIGKELYQVVDPAIGKPLAIIWAAVDDVGRVFIYNEWPHFEFQGSKDNNLGVKDYMELFKIEEENHPPQTRILDRHFGNARRTLGGLTLKQEFGEFGIDFVDSYSIADISAEVETGILKVKDMLRYNKEKPVDSLNCPRLIISENCTNTIHSFERWRRNEKTGKPESEYKDFADCVRYLAMSNPEIEKKRIWDVSPAYYRVES